MDSRRRASPEDYELAAEEIRQEIRKLSLEKQRMSQKKKRLQRKAPKGKCWEPLPQVAIKMNQRQLARIIYLVCWCQKTR